MDNTLTPLDSAWNKLLAENGLASVLDEHTLAVVKACFTHGWNLALDHALLVVGKIGEKKETNSRADQ